MTATTLPTRAGILPAKMALPIVAHWKLVALGLFGLWVFLIGSHHEPWFDEAQAWLLARDNDLWPLLTERVRYEGSPGLWHAVLWFAIRAGLPYDYLFLLPASFAVAGAAVVLWRAPFPPALRLAVIGSYFFGYQFSVVARSYCLDLLLVPLLATFFADRTEKPWRYALVIGLVANGNSHGFLVAAILGLELAWRIWSTDKWRTASGIGALLLAGVFGIAALATVMQPADNDFLRPEWRPTVFASFVKYISNAFIDRLVGWSTAPVNAVNILVGCGLSLILQRPVIGLVSASRNRLLALAIIGVLIGFSVFIYSSPWHAGLLFLFWIFILWTNWDVAISSRLRREILISLTLICLLQATETIGAGVWDLRSKYAQGEAAAAIVADYRESHPGARVAGLGYKAFDIQPWLPVNAFANYHGGSARPAYILWDKSEDWSTRVNHETLRKISQGRFDLVVASPFDPHDGIVDLKRWGCKSGYVVRQTLPATMIWRGAKFEDERLMILERGNAGCARQHQPTLP